MAVQPSLGTYLAFQLNAEFAKKHHSVADALCTAARASKGKWAVGEAGSSTTSSKNNISNVHTMSRKRYVLPLLLQARRVALSDAQRAFESAF